MKFTIEHNNSHFSSNVFFESYCNINTYSFEVFLNDIAAVLNSLILLLHRSTKELMDGSPMTEGCSKRGCSQRKHCVRIFFQTG